MRIVSFVSSFLFSLRQAPSSTLFPYTTLFRSRCCGARSSTSTSRKRSAALPAVPGVVVIELVQDDEARYRREHRESTRLNSNHQRPTYIGLCLPKNDQNSFA